MGKLMEPCSLDQGTLGEQGKPCGHAKEYNELRGSCCGNFRDSILSGIGSDEWINRGRVLGLELTLVALEN